MIGNVYPVRAAAGLVKTRPEDHPGVLAEIRAGLERLSQRLDSLLRGERQALREPAACQVVGLKRSSFRARQNPDDPAWDPTFPQGFKLGDSLRSPTVWFRDELEAWLETRAATARRNAGGRS